VEGGHQVLPDRLIAVPWRGIVAKDLGRVPDPFVTFLGRKKEHDSLKREIWGAACKYIIESPGWDECRFINVEDCSSAK
jgi:hypothetical protein